jgi:hypothetical protein
LYFLGLIYVLERVSGALPPHEVKLFDLVPLRYVFDLADLAVLVAYAIYGTIEAIRVFRSEEDRE